MASPMSSPVNGSEPLLVFALAVCAAGSDPFEPPPPELRLACVAPPLPR